MANFSLLRRRNKIPVIDRSFYDEFKEYASGKVTIHEVPLSSMPHLPNPAFDDAQEQNEEWQDFFGSTECVITM